MTEEPSRQAVNLLLFSRNKGWYSLIQLMLNLSSRLLTLACDGFNYHQVSKVCLTFLKFHLNERPSALRYEYSKLFTILISHRFLLSALQVIGQSSYKLKCPSNTSVFQRLQDLQSEKSLLSTKSLKAKGSRPKLL